MAINPKVWVTCDECLSMEEFDMTPLARGAWDMRDLVRSMQRAGWRAESLDGPHVCPSCVEDGDDDDVRGGA